MRSNRDDRRPAVPADKNEQVVCALHGARRLAKLCVYKPVFNADRVLIDYTYECRDDCSCKKREARPRETPPTPSAATVTEIPEAEVSEAAPVRLRTLNRYYDLENQRGGSGTVKKVCWHCGIEGHEKPDCPNVLCRVCHTTRGHHHTCQEPSLSPFIVLNPSLPLVVDMTNVRCVSCFEMGHMDCSGHITLTSTISCCFCGEEGHNAYECRRRQEVAPDRWLSRIKNREWAEGHGGSFDNRAFANVKNSSSSYSHERGKQSSLSYGGESRLPRANPSASWDRRPSRQHWENNGHSHHHTDSNHTNRNKRQYDSPRHREHYKDNRGDYNRNHHRDYERNSYENFQGGNRRDYHQANFRDHHADGKRSHREHRHVGREQEDRDFRGSFNVQQGMRRQRDDAFDDSRDYRRSRHELPQSSRNVTSRDTHRHRSQTHSPQMRWPPHQRDDDLDDIF